MAALKKGSQGGPVEKLQELLNKNGAKPPLKVDGIFGKKTDKAVREFQKKVKLKVDGKAGDFTMAAARYGGPLPEMKIEDYKKLKKGRLEKSFNTDLILQEFENIETEINKLAPVIKKELATAYKFINDNDKFEKEANKLSLDVIAKQMKFEVVLLKDPKAAAKLAQECEALDARVDKLYDGNIRPNVRKASQSTSKIARQIDDSLTKANNSVAYLKRMTT